MKEKSNIKLVVLLFNECWHVQGPRVLAMMGRVE